jgi:hypothetical protein
MRGRAASTRREPKGGTTTSAEWKSSGSGPSRGIVLSRTSAGGSPISTVAGSSGIQTSIAYGYHAAIAGESAAALP